MIAVDLDGTLLAGKSRLPEENVRALKRAMDAGVRVVIASGRMIEATMPIARALGVNAPMSLFNGSMIYDGETDRILSGRTISLADARQVALAAEARGIHLQAYPGRRYYFRAENEWTRFYADKVGVTGCATGDKLSDWLSGAVYKLLCLGSAQETTAFRDEMLSACPQLDFIKSSDTHLEIVARGVDKAYGLSQVAGRLGIAPAEIMAFGDEQNDLPMLTYAGFGYAMDNASPLVKAAIKRIAPANTQCGVAKIVELYLNEGRMGRG